MTAVLALALAVLQAPARELVVRETRIACRTEPYLRTVVWERDGESYVAGRRRIAVAEVERIRSALIHAKEPEDLLCALGLPRAEIEAHAEQLLEQGMSLGERVEEGFPLDFDEACRALVSYDVIAPKMRQSILQTGSTTLHSFEATLPGDPPISVRSSGCVPSLLPWTIVVGGSEREVAAPAIPALLLPLAAEDSPNRSVLDASEFWREEVWTSGEGPWGFALVCDLRRQMERRPRVRLPGHDARSARWYVGETVIGEFDGRPRALRVDLSATYQRRRDVQPVVLGVLWSNPMPSDFPLLDWYVPIALEEGAESRAARFPPLESWLSADTGRSTQLAAYGDQAISRRDLAERTWKAAHLRGAPEFELRLLSGQVEVATVFLGEEGLPAVVARATPLASGAGIDALEIDAAASDRPRCAVWNADGSIEVIEVAGKAK